MEKKAEAVEGVSMAEAISSSARGVAATTANKAMSMEEMMEVMKQIKEVQVDKGVNVNAAKAIAAAAADIRDDFLKIASAQESMEAADQDYEGMNEPTTPTTRDSDDGLKMLQEKIKKLIVDAIVDAMPVIKMQSQRGPRVGDSRIKEQVYPDAKQFRYKPLPHANEMEQLFGGVTATGDHRFGSADDDHLLDDHRSMSQNPTPNTETPSPPPGPEGSVEPDPVQTESNYEDRMSDVRRKRPCPSRRRRNSEDTIVEKIDGVLDKIVNSASSHAPISTNTVPTIDECYASLRETPSFVLGTSLYINALRYINIPENRRLWMLELDPTSRAMLVEAHFSG
ncbi:hypothetical protein QJS10_CPB04g00428 [Acorus calamus]|uniref:Uncharacterized protein n=1 Tax=Acorus calamus TaxID=4465 RepID=A0AAV9EZL3_ACOCL|nr:hypothetical protein QJS10_CPB04g00428 [Acorus calamus]